jgi:uncharacterized membrane protein
MSLSYRKKLAEDLPRWVAEGWVRPEGAQAILAEVSNDGPDWQNRIVGILSILGAVLIGAGVISFVAANWQEMPRLVRLGLMVGMLWAAYGAGAFLFERGLALFAHGAVLVGSVVFGASVMLVAQMYHLHGNPPDAVIVWGAGALLAGLLMRSNPSLVLSLLLVCLWGGWETQLRGGVFWLFLPAWGVVVAAMIWRGCEYGVKLAAVALGVWIVSLGYTLPGSPRNELVLAIGAAIAGGGLALQYGGQMLRPYGRLAVALGFGVAIAALLGLQFIDWRRELWSVIGLAAVTLTLSLAAVAWGVRTQDRWLMRAAFVAFAIEVVSLYARTLGTLMNTSFFFVGAGVGVIALALLAFWLNRKLGERMGAIS